MEVPDVRSDIKLQKILELSCTIKKCLREQQKKVGSAKNYLRHMMRSEPQQPESITVKEPEEQEDTPVTAEEKFAVTTVNIFECGHIIERGENVTATAREAEGIMQQYGGYNY